MKRLTLASLILSILAGLVAAYSAGRQSHQNVNDLIRVGFLVIAPPDTDMDAQHYTWIEEAADESGLLVSRFDE